MSVYSRTIQSYEDPDAVRLYAQTLLDHRDEGLHAYVADVSRRLRKGARILDVGSGTGLDVARLREMGFEAFGVDISQAMVDHATKTIGQYFSVADIRSMSGLFKQPFCAVICIAVFLHVEKSDAALVLRQLRSLLDIGGFLVLCTKAGCGYFWDTRLGVEYPRATILYSREEFEQLLVDGEFDIEDLRETTVARKLHQEAWLLSTSRAR